MASLAVPALAQTVSRPGAFVPISSGRAEAGSAFGGISSGGAAASSIQAGDTVTGTGVDVWTAQPLELINSPDRDDTPIITADGRQMYFNSTRHGQRPWARIVQGRYDDDIYVATSAGRADAWREPLNLRAINTGDDDGVVAMSSSGNLLYYLSLRRDWKENGGPFYQAERRGTGFSSMTGLGGGITRFFEAVPVKGSIRIFGASMSADGRSFYFATTAFSRSGDHEIWVSERSSPDAEWGVPKNLGAPVNVGSGSYAPFIAADGRTLYFSSGRPGGIGGDDIYMTVYKDGQWRRPINLGTPINGPADDAFLSLPASGDRVYFASTRSGQGDLFVAPMRPEIRPSNVALLTARVYDDQNGEPLEALVTIEELPSRRTVVSAKTDSAEGHVSAVLHPGGSYIVSISAPGFLFETTSVEISDDSTFAEIERTFRLRRPDPDESVRLRTIEFDYRSATLRPESYPELERLAAFLATSHDVRIAVHGHTDSIGTDSYNRRLSLDRAAAVRDYLISQGGISASRIEIEGFGFSRPVSPNSDEIGRELNRRVEFVILGPLSSGSP